ncbi:MAG: hypothetical protein N3F62_00110 [Bacteroidia bacterium]|nr:hypothetical protein [Bacteroidia bacterium]
MDKIDVLFIFDNYFSKFFPTGQSIYETYNPTNVKIIQNCTHLFYFGENQQQLITNN